MAPQRKKLSGHLLEMKFMKKSKEDREKQEEEEKYAQVFESDQIKEEETGTRVNYQPNIAILENLVFPRRSYGGLNPALEKIMAEIDGVPEETVSGNLADDRDVTDREMAEHYGSLVETMGKKFTKKRKRSPEEESGGLRTPSKPPVVKKAREFLKPNEDGFV